MNPVLVPVDVVAGEKQTPQFDFKVYIGEIVAGKTEAPQSLLRIYPNPFGDGFFAENPGNVERFSIYNLSGYLVKVLEEVTGHVDMTGFESGIYVIEVLFSNGDRQHTKLVKQ